MWIVSWRWNDKVNTESFLTLQEAQERWWQLGLEFKEPSIHLRYNGSMID